MRRLTILSLLLIIISSTSVYAQDKVPAALEQRLVAFTDQVFSEWMNTGDIRSVNSMRVQEILNDPPCALIVFTDGAACRQVSKEERADHMLTMDNVIGLMVYRVLSQSVAGLMAAFSQRRTDDDPSGLRMMARAASFSEQETSLLSELLGPAKDVNEFHQRLPKYKELEKMLQADHLKNFAASKAQYAQNAALIDQAMRGGASVFKAEQTDVPGAPAGGEYFAVRKGLFIFFVRVMGDEMKFTSAPMLTR